MRPRLSPCSTGPSIANGVAEQRARVLERAARDEAADVARADDLPVDLEQRHDARLEAPDGPQQLRVALRAVAEAEVLADADERRAEPPDEHLVDERLRAARANDASNSITTSSSTPSDATSSALRSSVVSSRGSCPGATTAVGCGSKVSTASAPEITSRCPRWTPSNVADGDAPRARLRLARAG